MKSKYKIAVLITCHNRRDKTLLCLGSLFRASLQPGYELKVHLVDDGSEDGTGDAVKSQFPEVNIIQGNGSLFWNRGMHLAWKTAVSKHPYDYYIWLNDDVELLVTAISDLIAASKIKPGSIICGTTQSRHQRIATYGGRDNNGTLLEPNGIIQSCHHFNGNLVLVPESVYQIVGNIDPIFPHSMGDFDYALRAKRKGVHSFVCPDFTGICEAHTSISKWCLPGVPFLSRVKSLYSPLGRTHPYYYFRFELRHYGIFTALKHFFSIHLRLIYPKLHLWKS
jgi:GT2 family glycosyltransferase